MVIDIAALDRLVQDRIIKPFNRQDLCKVLGSDTVRGEALTKTIWDLRLVRAATTGAFTDYKALVCLFLFGGNDRRAKADADFFFNQVLVANPPKSSSLQPLDPAPLVALLEAAGGDIQNEATAPAPTSSQWTAPGAAP